MPSPRKTEELKRLQSAFESEAAKFHDASLSIFYFTQEHFPTGRKFQSPNHMVMLWQYYGQLSDDDAQIRRFVENLQASDIKRAGVRGSNFSCFALVEGTEVARFVRMATRAGSVFSEDEAQRIRMRASKDFKSNLPKEKSIFIGNTNPLSIWLNHVLYHLGNTHPRYLSEVKLHLDPFAASLSAIDELLKPRSRRSQRKRSKLESKSFQVALSFSGERRPYVASVAETLRKKLGNDAVFYDAYYQAELARPNLDTLLQRLYHNNSELIVVFLCEDYATKEWCGLEWRAIRDLIKSARDEQIMLLRFDSSSIPGIFGVDGYLDISAKTPEETAEAIISRLNS
jgi:hypothetical protein